MKNRLVYDNQWEYDNYLIGKKKIATLAKVSIKGKEYDVKTQHVGVPYHDMGHDYTAVSDHYFIKEIVFGMAQTFDLNQLVPKIAVIAIEFTLEGEK
jgi:hypothetical protein